MDYENLVYLKWLTITQKFMTQAEKICKISGDDCVQPKLWRRRFHSVWLQAHLQHLTLLWPGLELLWASERVIMTERCSSFHSRVWKGVIRGLGKLPLLGKLHLHQVLPPRQRVCIRWWRSSVTQIHTTYCFLQQIDGVNRMLKEEPKPTKLYPAHIQTAADNNHKQLFFCVDEFTLTARLTKLLR